LIQEPCLKDCTVGVRYPGEVAEDGNAKRPTLSSREGCEGRQVLGQFQAETGIRRRREARKNFRASAQWGAGGRNSRVNIVDITEFYSERGGGIRSHLTSRGHFLCQLGHHHTVIAPGPRDDDAGNCTHVAPGAGCTRVIRIAGPALPYDRSYHWLGRFDKIRAHVRARPPDVLEAHSPYLAMAAVLACGRAAPVRTAFWHADHVGTYVEPALTKALGPTMAGWASAPLWQGVRALLAPFDATFVAGRAQTERLRAAGVSNVVPVPFGVDARTFHPHADRASRRRELLGDAGEGAALLVGVGRFAIEKRWDVVLDAFERVRAKRAAVLVLFGDGPERARLERRASAGVRFAGFERDRARLGQSLGAADLLVHGCPYETYGLGVAEAVACGLPVVVPDAGGAAESADLSSAETYASLDIAACAAAIDRLLDRNPAELRARALEAASRVPTIDRHFATVLATYDALLKERSPRHARSRLDP
jgi:alpha-1,6-mannosyltransferase